MSPAAKSWLKQTLRWGIAIGGIWYVVSNLTLRDQVLAVLDTKTNLPVRVALKHQANEDAETFDVIDPHTHEVVPVARANVVNAPDTKTVNVDLGKGPRSVQLLGMDLSGDLNKNPVATRLLVLDPATGNGQWIPPGKVPGGHQVRVPRPRVDVGLIRMVRDADQSLLWAAVFIIPLIQLIVAYRWNELLKALDIRLGQGRTLTLTLVGLFYNTFMPGSTGGDVLKAYYVAKHTPHRTRAVMSVIIDRVIGLLALVIMGGTLAAFQTDNIDCQRVAIGSGIVIFSVIVGLLIFFTPALRRLVGLDFLLSRLPMQKQVQNALQTVEILGKHPLLVLWALIVTFPVHATVVLSATFAGKAFGLPLSPGYYWVVVPVVVLVGAIPISPQGAGVMEFFAIHLTAKQGATVGQAFALTMSIRLVQLVWNLLAGIVVLRGGYHTPTAAEETALSKPA